MTTPRIALAMLALALCIGASACHGGWAKPASGGWLAEVEFDAGTSYPTCSVVLDMAGYKPVSPGRYTVRALNSTPTAVKVVWSNGRTTAGIQTVPPNRLITSSFKSVTSSFKFTKPGTYAPTCIWSARSFPSIGKSLAIK